MSTDIARYEEGRLSFPKCRFSDTSLEIDPAISGKEYLNLWDGLKKVSGVLPWWIGDAYIFGELNEGFRFDSVLSNFRLEYKKTTIRNCVYVCSRIPPSRRRDKLTFGHHQAVAPLEPSEQDYYLDLAQRGGYSVKALRQLIKEDAASREAAVIKTLDIIDNIDLSKKQFAYLVKCKSDIYKLDRKIIELIAWKSAYMRKETNYRPERCMRTELLELKKHLTELLELEEDKASISNSAEQST